MKKLPLAFYKRNDPLKIGHELIGKILVSKWDQMITAGRIVETEAYVGIDDKASHAFGGRRTNRNEVMYAEGGVAYVYLCYGIHHLFNVVTGDKDVPHAILIRALEPVVGINEMLFRSGKLKPDQSITRGPGKLSKAMGINLSHNGYVLNSKHIYIADDGFHLHDDKITRSPRIGVSYAGDDALLPYRFFISGNKFVSGKQQ